MISCQIFGINFRIFRINLRSAFSIFGKKSVNSSLFLFLIIFACVLALSFPAAADDENADPNILIPNGSAVLRTGETFRFFQGYEVTLKGFGAENVLLEIYCNDSNLSTFYHIGSTDLEEGETLQCYKRTKTGVNIVFMMTLESMYLNNSEIIAEFSHIYQYNDSEANDFPMVSDWIIYTDTLGFPPSNDSNNPKEDTKPNNELFVDPIFIISSVVLAAILIILLYFHSNKKR